MRRADTVVPVPCASSANSAPISSVVDGVEAGGRLVGDDDGVSRCECTGERDALALTRREEIHAAVGMLRRVRRPQAPRLPRRPISSSGDTAERESELDVLAGGEEAGEPRCLADDRDAVAAQRRARRRGRATTGRCPRARISPSSGTSIPVRSARSVDLPEPEARPPPSAHPARRSRSRRRERPGRRTACETPLARRGTPRAHRAERRSRRGRRVSSGHRVQLDDPFAATIRARSWIPAARRVSSGIRSHPPAPTTAVSDSPWRSSLTRPSRMWTTRSAISVEAGSWLTRIAAERCSVTSSASSASTSRADSASRSPVGSSAMRSLRAIAPAPRRARCAAALRRTAPRAERPRDRAGRRARAAPELAPALALRHGRQARAARRRAPPPSARLPGHASSAGPRTRGRPADSGRARASTHARDRRPPPRASRRTAGRALRERASASSCPSRSARARRTSRPRRAAARGPGAPRLLPSRTDRRRTARARRRSAHASVSL